MKEKRFYGAGARKLRSVMPLAAAAEQAAARLFPGSGAVLRATGLASPLPDPAGFLCPTERLRLKDITSLKRRRQWLGGRLAVKRAAAAHIGCDAAELAIRPEEDGRPVLLRGGKAEKTCVSISHSHDMAVAVAAAAPCGIDVERISPRPARLAERFSLPQESRLLEPVGDETGYTMLWCAKEALRKAIRPMPGFLGLELCRMEAHEYGYIMAFSTPATRECRCFAAADGTYALALFVGVQGPM